tara:strand:- start:1063 stop:1704 length:642 start_codon:yes stop_codon:yes gene_type:complete
MFFKYFCLNSKVAEMLDILKGEEVAEGENENPIYKNPIVINYREELYNLYKKYKVRKVYSIFLRFLQATAGIGITAMTTANNPYFKDNVDQINIILWYVSITNNIVNALLEKTQAYDLPNDKLKINLLVGEAKKLLDNYKDYSLYEDNLDNKLKYFEKCYNEILKQTPYEYLLYQGRRPSHVSFDARKRRLEILEEAWAENDEVDKIIISNDL